ncbi:nickel-dependent lactate racemase [Microlunatus panaciterrae]|uniref:Nickel-dependent lactate racemase n=1 Tax=Microlunatus panaciterrae TaxID=400768 RepID=A0ABS2RPM7_9ACTN|nr:nickel-dependent lactate racemase [Microlunatus panaciterrae]MBM7800116.1 nickel-dependent lactate racemase [Microlunatus panaciterrae]
MPGTRQIRLAYGRDGLVVDLPSDQTTVIEPSYRPGVADPAAEVRRALREPVAGLPLRERLAAAGASRDSTVAISVCDGTRAQPREVMVPAVLAEIADLVDLDRVTILVATGTHRGNDDAELREMLTDAVVDRVRVVNHDARDPDSLTWCGTAGNGVPVWLNTHWVEADIKITTGFVEPHFFAGFSGGPKMIAPGLAGLDTVLVLHDAARIADPRATWGVTETNPVHDDVRAIAAQTGATYAVDVVMNRDHEIVEAFGGDLLAMHAAACEKARELAMVPVDGPFDVVVTTNSGYPLDQNLYQAVKGMSAGAMVVKPGGVLVAVAECSDGFPDHGSYVDVLTSAESPAALLAQIEGRSETVPDQWQVQIQAKVQTRARVSVHCAGLTGEQLATAHLGAVDDVGAFVLAALAAAGPGARCCVLPEGPQTIPYLR